MTGWKNDAVAAKDVAGRMKHRVRLLDAAENEKTRELYRKVFREDSERFVEYYYHKKTRENRIYAVESEEGEILSMLHLNPYLVRLGRLETFGEYVVAVATDENYRHQGMMRSLLKASLEDMRRIGEPFAFLMPADEAIYRPFGFRFIYRQNRSILDTGAVRKKPGLCCQSAGREDLDRLEKFANAYLSKHYRSFAFHTREYFETLLEEQKCQNGEVVMLMKEGEVCGWFFTALEDGAEVREAVIEDGYEEYLLPAIAGYLPEYEQIKLYGFPESVQEEQKKEPLIMGRIINPQQFVTGLRAEEKITFVFELQDSLLEENTGIYRFTADCEGGSMEKCTDTEPAFSIGIDVFTELVFGMRSAKKAGMPDQIAREWKKVQDLAPVLFNEVV